MADEEKKLSDATDATAKADAAKPEKNSTVSHSEPAVVHSGEPLPPLTDDQDHAPGHASNAHGHDAHASDDHAHSASGAEFGEVIPEKNWQDSFLATIAAVVLCGFLFVGFTWSQVTPPPEHEEKTEVAEPVHSVDTNEKPRPAPAFLPQIKPGQSEPTPEH